jgi:hypothetical protein
MISPSTQQCTVDKKNISPSPQQTVDRKMITPSTQQCTVDGEGGIMFLSTVHC